MQSRIRFVWSENENVQRCPHIWDVVSIKSEGMIINEDSVGESPKKIGMENVSILE